MHLCHYELVWTCRVLLFYFFIIFFFVAYIVPKPCAVLRLFKKRSEDNFKKKNIFLTKENAKQEIKKY